MAETKIEWCDKVWNPVTGCSPVSAGCANCYAERIANRFWGDRKFTDVQYHPERLSEPLKWRKPKKIFVNSMSDLFHEDVPDEFISEVFAIMAVCQQHTFMILTKRPKRMQNYFRESSVDGIGPYHSYIGKAAKRLGDRPNVKCRSIVWPLPNVWLGVTAENQETADERIPILLQIPAAVRFVSCEPLLESINLVQSVNKLDWLNPASFKPGGLDWIICGPETGPGKRPMKREWIENLYQQCQSAEVPFFDKKNVLGLNLKQFPEVAK